MAEGHTDNSFATFLNDLQAGEIPDFLRHDGFPEWIELASASLLESELPALIDSGVDTFTQQFRFSQVQALARRLIFSRSAGLFRHLRPLWRAFGASDEACDIAESAADVCSDNCSLSVTASAIRNFEGRLRRLAAFGDGDFLARAVRNSRLFSTSSRVGFPVVFGGNPSDSFRSAAWIAPTKSAPGTYNPNPSLQELWKAVGASVTEAVADLSPAAQACYLPEWLHRLMGCKDWGAKTMASAGLSLAMQLVGDHLSRPLPFWIGFTGQWHDGRLKGVRDIHGKLEASWDAGIFVLFACRDPDERDLTSVPGVHLELLPEELSLKDVVWHANRTCLQMGLPTAFRGWIERIERVPSPHDSQDFGGGLQHLRKDFCDRPWLFEEVGESPVHLGAVEALPVHPRERLLLIVGDIGTGKSTFLAEFAYRNLVDGVLAYHFCQAGSQETLAAACFVRSLAGMLYQTCDGYRQEVSSVPAARDALTEASCASDCRSAFEHGVLAPLLTLNRSVDIIHYIVIDSLEEAFGATGGSPTILDLLSSYAERLPEWLRIIATTRRDSEVLLRLSGVRRLFIDGRDAKGNEDPVCKANIREDIGPFIATRLKQVNLAERLAQSRVSAQQASDSLLAKGELNFQYVTLALECIERDNYGFDRLEELPPGLYGLYLTFFERTFPKLSSEDSYGLPRLVFEVMLAAQEPPNDQMLAASTGIDGDYKLPALLRKLEFYIPPRHSDGATTYHFVYPALRRWLADKVRAGRFFASAKKGHKRLAQAGWREYERGVDSLSPYFLRHLPHHLIQTVQWDRLAALLTDLNFLEAKAKMNLVGELLEDLERGSNELAKAKPEKAETVELLARSLRMDLPFIALHPESLFQTLYNRGQWDHEPLRKLVDRWRNERPKPRIPWLRSLTPPDFPIGGLLRTTLGSHAADVSAAAVSNDGRWVATGDVSGVVCLHDIELGALPREFHVYEEERRELLDSGQYAIEKGSSGAIACLAISAGGRYIAARSADRRLHLWDAKNDRRTVLGQGDGFVINALAFHPDTLVLAGGGRNGKVSIWNLDASIWDSDKRHGRRQAAAHHAGIVALAFSCDGTSLVTAAEDGTVRMWHGKEWRRGRMVTLADAGTGKTNIKRSMWRTMAGVPLGKTLIKRACFSTDAGRLAAADIDCNVGLWDTATGALIAVIPNPDDGQTGSLKYLWDNDIAILEDGSRIATGGEDGSIRLWNVEAREPQLLAPANNVPVTRLVAIPGTQLLVSTWLNATPKIWDVSRISELSRSTQPSIQGDWPSFRKVVEWQYVANGRYLAAVDADSVVLFDTNTGARVAQLRGPGGGAWYPTCIAAHDGALPLVIVGGWGAVTAVLKWDLSELEGTNGKEAVMPYVQLLDSRDAQCTCLALCEDGTELVGCSPRREIRVWDVRTGKPLYGRTFPESPQVARALTSWWGLRPEEEVPEAAVSFRAVAISRDKRYIAAATEFYERILIWNSKADTWRWLAVKCHEGTIDRLLFSSDSRMLASGAEDNYVHVWDVETCNHLFTVGARMPTPAVFDDPYRGWERSIEGGQTKLHRRGHEIWLPGTPNIVANPGDPTRWAGPDVPPARIMFLRIEDVPHD